MFSCVRLLALAISCAIGVGTIWLFSVGLTDRQVIYWDGASFRRLGFPKVSLAADGWPALTGVPGLSDATAETDATSLAGQADLKILVAPDTRASCCDILILRRHYAPDRYPHGSPTRRSSSFEALGIHATVERSIGYGTARQNWHVSIPLWIMVVLALLYPTGRAAQLLMLRCRRNWRTKHGVCMSCGYNLRGNVSGACPECGQTTSDKPDDSGKEPG